MLKHIGISQPHASHLMQIGEQFGNQCNVTALPTSMRALYELSRLDSEQVTNGIATDHMEQAGMTVAGLLGHPPVSYTDASL